MGKIILKNKLTNEIMELEGSLTTPPIGWEIIPSKKEKHGGVKKNANGDGSFYYSQALQKWVGQYGRKTVTQKKNESKTDCKRRWENLKSELNNGTYIEKSNDTLYKILERFIKQKFKDGVTSGGTYKRNQETLQSLKKCCSNFIDKPIRDVVIEDIEDAKEEIRLYAPNTIDKIWGMLKSGFRIANARKKIAFNIMEDDTLIKPISVKGTKKIEALTLEEEKRFRDIMNNEEKNHKYRNVVILQINTGMRIGEDLARTLDDFNEEDNSFNIWNTLTHDENNNIVIGKHTKVYDKKHGIDKGARIIPLDNESIGIIKEIKKSKIKNMYNFIFWDYENNTFVSYAEINSWLDRINEKYHITKKELSTHVLRHTRITRLQEAGVPLVVIQYLVGHVEGSKMTNDVYTDVSLSFAKDALKNAQNI